jgi:hypothetical protein
MCQKFEYLGVQMYTHYIKEITLSRHNTCKHENIVRLISYVVDPTVDHDPASRPDRGRPTTSWLVGPCHTALYKQRGGVGARTPMFVVATLPTYNPKPPIRLVRCSGGKLRHRRHHSVAVMASMSQVKPDGTAPLLLPLHSFSVDSTSSRKFSLFQYMKFTH